MWAEPSRWTVLPPPTPEGGRAVLAPPLLSLAAARAAALAVEARALCVPVALAVPAGLRGRIARALHACTGGEGDLLASSDPRPDFASVPPGATVLVAVDGLAADALPVLEALIDDGAVWVLAAHEPHAALGPVLWQRLGAVAIEVAPLGERPAEIAALSAHIVERLLVRSGRVASPLSPAVLDALATRPWPGDVPELEAVLARALLLAPEGPIEPSHLGSLGVAPPAATPVPPPEPAPVAAADTHLEYLIAELAHELRNPLVTVKTFAEHLPALLGDAELRERFAALAREAATRMDGLLENVTTFARLGTPRHEAVDLAAIVDALVAEAAPGLAERAVRVRRVGLTSGLCAGDPDHVAYALRNLLDGVFREVPPREEIEVDVRANGRVELRFATGREAAERLRRVASAQGTTALVDPAVLPLPFTLARAVLERGGGAIDLVPEADGAASVVVRLPPVGAEIERE